MIHIHIHVEFKYDKSNFIGHLETVSEMNPIDNFTKTYLQTNLGMKQKSTFPIHDVILKDIICCTEVQKELERIY